MKPDPNPKNNVKAISDFTSLNVKKIKHLAIKKYG